MPIREFSLGHIVLLGPNEDFTEVSLPRFAKTRRATLETCCPVIRLLQSADLCHKYSPAVDGLRIHFLLRERARPKYAIPLAGGVVVPENGDGFRLEAQAVRHALEEVRQRIALVTDPALTLDELISETTPAKERKALRQLIAKQRGGLLHLPGFGENPIAVPKVPRTLPVGTSLLITANIGTFSPGGVQLENIRRVGDDGIEFVDPKLGSCLPMTRDTYGPVAAFNALLIAAHDIKVRVRLEVVVVRNWAHAHPIKLHLVKVHPLFGPLPGTNQA